jgi:hypothetical protein
MSPVLVVVVGATSVHSIGLLAGASPPTMHLLSRHTISDKNGYTMSLKRRSPKESVTKITIERNERPVS